MNKDGGIVMKGKYISRLLLVALLAVVFAMQGAQFAPAEAKGHILSHIMNQDHFFHQVSQVYINKLDELSGGKMEIEYHLGGDLGDWVTQLDQAIQGIIPMTFTWNNSELDPRLDLAILGFVADDWDSARKVFGPNGLLEDAYVEIFDKLNLMMVGTVPNGFAGFVVRKGEKIPLNMPEDAKGFKIRIPQFVMGIERYKALGFSPVTIPFSELHTALQTGSVDGRAYGPAAEQPMFADVLEAFVFTREHLDHTFFIINKTWFKKLSEEEQGWVREAADFAVNWAWDNIKADEDAKLQECKDLGIKVVELDPEHQAEYKQIVRDAEWPLFEKIAGKELMDKVRAAAAEADAAKK